MKKQPLLITLLIFGIGILIFACRKDLKDIVTNSSIATSPALEAAKIWQVKQTQGDTSKLKLKPRWSKAFSVTKKDGTNMIVVPTVELALNQSNISIRRFYLFKMKGNAVKSGEIVEFVGQNYDVSSHLDELLSNLGSSKLVDYNGGIILYDVNYRKITSVVFSHGVRTRHGRIAIGTNIQPATLANFGFTRALKTMDLLDAYPFQSNCTYCITTNGYGEVTDIEELYCDQPTEGGSSSSASSSSSSAIHDPLVNYGGNKTYHTATLAVNNIDEDLCLKAVVQSLIDDQSTNVAFNKMFQDNFGNTGTVNIVFDDSAQGNNGTWAYTDGSSQHDFGVHFNTNNTNGASKELDFETAMHESYHAYLDANQAAKNYFDQHEYMISNYVEDEVDNLIAKFPNLAANNAHDAYALVLDGFGALQVSSDEGIEYFNQALNDYGLTVNDIVATREQYAKGGHSGTRC